MPELPKTYDPSSIEERWYQEWLARRYFHADAAAPKAPFSIVIPPPNLTWSLHLGHALGSTVQDIFTRWKRMAAYNAMWLPGTDHAGIATQLVVEREVKKTEGKTHHDLGCGSVKTRAEGNPRHDLGREEFLNRVWQWREKYGGRILDQVKVMGYSLD